MCVYIHKFLELHFFAFVGNYAEIIPRGTFPNSFDMFDGHIGK